MSDPSNTSKFAAGFPPGPTQSATTSAATSLPQGLQHAMSSASPIAPPASAATSAPTIVTRTSPSLVEWAIERNLKQSFLDPSNPALKCQLDAINTVLVDEGLPSVNDITGLVTNEDLKKELFALFHAQTLATKNTLSKIVAQLCTSLSEKKSDKRETEEKIPEPSGTEIRDLFSQAGLPMPVIELMGHAKLYGKLMRDNSKATNNRAFSDITLRKEAQPLSRQRVSHQDEDILDQLKRALKDDAQKPKNHGFFQSLADWITPYLVWAFAASACQKVNIV